MLCFPPCLHHQIAQRFFHKTAETFNRKNFTVDFYPWKKISLFAQKRQSHVFEPPFGGHRVNACTSSIPIGKCLTDLLSMSRKSHLWNDKITIIGKILDSICIWLKKKFWQQKLLERNIYHICSEACHNVDCLCWFNDVPQSISSQNNKNVVLFDVNNCHIWLWRNHICIFLCIIAPKITCSQQRKQS